METISWALERWPQLAGKLQERLRQIELRELDLPHIIEFYLPGEEMMIGLYRALHELRVERRRVKNELSALPAAAKATRSIPENTLAHALTELSKSKTRSTNAARSLKPYRDG